MRQHGASAETGRMRSVKGTDPQSSRGTGASTAVPVRARLQTFVRRWGTALWVAPVAIAAVVILLHPPDLLAATTLTLAWTFVLAIVAGLCLEASRPFLHGRRDRVLSYVLLALMVLPGAIAWALVVVAVLAPSGLSVETADRVEAAAFVLPFLLPMAGAALVIGGLILRRHGTVRDLRRFVATAASAPLLPLAISVATGSSESSPWVGVMLLALAFAFRRVVQVVRGHIGRITEPQRLYPA